MSITSVVNDLVTSVSVINALKPLPPTISGYSVGGLDDTALDPAGGQTVQINGTGFLAGATITFDGSAVAVVTYVNPNRLTFTSPAKTAGTYTIYAVNPDGGTAIFIPGIIYSVLPTWTTSAGSLGSYYETTSISNTVIATGDAPITYSLFSGSLPAGSTLYANGVITGTAPVDSSSTTYSFTIQATDAQLQDSTRSFSLTINVDAVTWVSPANATTYTSAVDSAISNVALSATDAAGYAVSYSANALPTGLSLSGANISGTPTVIADSSTLLTATAATTNRSATRTINWSITVANDTYFEYNTLLIPGASTTFVDDASTNNFAVTINGDTKPNGSNPYTPGYYSNYFNGSTSYLNIGSTVPATLVFGTSDFTVECWVNFASIPAGTCLMGNLNAGSTVFGVWSIYFYGSPTYKISFFCNAPAVGYDFAYTITPNQWVHLAICRASGSIRAFINGVQIGSTQSSSVNITNSGEQAGGFYIGRANDGVGYFPGYLSNIRILKGTGLYTAAFTPPTSPLTAIANTSLLTSQSNRFIDNSTNTYTLTAGASTQVSSFDPFVPNSSYSTYGSGYFDGTGDYLSVANNAAFNFGSGAFTVEFWVYMDATYWNQCFVTNYGGSSTGWTLQTQISGYLTASLSGDGVDIQGSTPMVNGVWHHVALSGTSGSVKLFLNGVQQGSTFTGAVSLDTSTALSIGQIASTNYLVGSISNVRLVKGTAVYTTAFTPPTSPLTAIANTSLLVLQNNQSVNNSVFLDNSTNNFLVTRNGNTTQGTFSPYGGNWSNYFDGTGDYLSTPAGLTTAMGTGFAGNIISIEGWIFPTSFPSANAYGTGLIGAYQAVSANGRWWFGIRGSAGTTGNLLFAWTISTSTESSVISTSNSIILNQWNHVAITIQATTSSSTTIKMFINGVLVDTFTGNNLTTQTSYYASPNIGGNYSQYVNYYVGYISNLSILKGVLVYTGNYTVPTTPLTPVANTVLLTCQSNRLIDNSVNNFTMTKNGDVSVQRFSPFNPSSLTPTSYSGYFDGNGDYLNAPSNAVFGFGTGDFTIEGWFYFTGTIGTYQRPWWFGDDNDNIEINGSVLRVGGASQGTLITGGTTIVASTWYHIALTRASGSYKLWLNGSQQGSTATNSYNSSARTFTAMATSGGANPSTGYVSNLRIVKGTAVYTTTFTPSTTPLTAISGTSLLTLQSTTFIDNSTNNLTLTPVGNSQPTIQNPFGFTSATTNGYTVSTIGGSGYFDGTGDYLSFANSPTFANLNGNNFTVECWAYATTVASNICLMACTSNPTTTGFAIFILSGNLTVYVNTGSTVVGSIAFPTNAWNHVAFVRNSTTCTLYLNGVFVASATANITNPAATQPLVVGGITSSTGWNSNLYLTGYLSDVRVVNGTALYTSNFVPPSAPLTAVQNTSALNNMTSAGIYDAAMMTNMETVADAKLSTAISKFGGSSMYFDGTGDYITVSGNQQVKYSMGLGDFTVEMWINAISVASGGNLYDTNNAGDVSGAGRFGIELLSNNQVKVYIGTGTAIVTGGTINTGTWYHIAYSKASGSGKLFVNGIQVGSTYTDTNNYICGNLNRPVFGINGYDNASGPFNGYIDDLRVTKGYARYTANFTPPTSAFPIY